jgi:hypothetical protein
MALKSKQIPSQSLAFGFTDIKPVYQAFSTMARERTFDVSENGEGSSRYVSRSRCCSTTPPELGR